MKEELEEILWWRDFHYKGLDYANEKALERSYKK